MYGDLRRYLLYRLFRQNWTIGAIVEPVHVVAGLSGTAEQQRALRSVRWMAEQRGTFAADPFPVQCGAELESCRIFYEHYDWRKGKGDIYSVVYSESKFASAEAALNSPYHLSYPFVLHDDGAGPCVIPEHSEAKDVSMYRVNEHGSLLSRSSMLLRGEWVDPTIVRHGDRYWMFATKPGERVNIDLYLLFASCLTGAWRMHGQAPVKSDLSNARPAGQVFSYKGALFRPAQNCSNFYGESININRITKLTETEFAETQEAEVRPIEGWKYDFGLHTLSSVSGVSVIDAARLENKLWKSFDGLAHVLKG